MSTQNTHKLGILVADDEDNLRDIISFNLQQEGYDVYPAKDGEEAWKIFTTKKHRLHLALLDVSMPKINGFDLCEKIKSVDDKFPVFFLTVRNDREDRVFGLKIGADDYLSKPFDLEELLLRVKKILQRFYLTDKITINGRSIHFETHIVRLPDGKEKILSTKEADLLRYLLMNKNKIVSRQEILEAVWGEKAEEASYRTIDNIIVEYRKLFEDNSKQPKHFLSVRGVGYMFKE